MGDCFTLILKMSLTASFVIAAVLLVRLLLARAPRRYSYVLWLVVLVRLICPAALETRFGVVPNLERMLGQWQQSEEQKADELMHGSKQSEDGVWMTDREAEDTAKFTDIQEIHVALDAVDISILGDEEWKPRSEETGHEAGMRGGTDSGQHVWWISEAAWNIVGLCWLCGCLLFLGYGFAGYLRLMYCLHRKKEQLVDLHENEYGQNGAEAYAVLRHRRIRILEDSGIGALFTVGVFRPVICLPKGLLSFQREMVITHETMHIRRQDNFLKLVAYTVRCIHWFNPFVWLAFRYFEEDMETSCDEAVLSRIGYERRKEYAKTLLALSECGGQAGAFNPVSFSRKSSKARIRHVLSMKKTRLWVALAATAVVVAAAVGLLANHKSVQKEPEAQQEIIEAPEEQEKQRQAALEEQRHAEQVEALEEQVQREMELLAQHEDQLQTALADAEMESMPDRKIVTSISAEINENVAWARFSWGKKGYMFTVRLFYEEKDAEGNVRNGSCDYTLNGDYTSVSVTRVCPEGSQYVWVYAEGYVGETVVAKSPREYAK